MSEQLEYKRLRDIDPPTFDSLEKLCTAEAVFGWRILMIEPGNQWRTATLVRDVPTVKIPAQSATVTQLKKKAA